jgi:hypothetical protein
MTKSRLRTWNTVVSTIPEDQGIEFVITRLLVGDQAELKLKNSGEVEGDITRPLAVLRRVPKPTPPIEGMPKERPLCAWCGCKLAPAVRYTHADGQWVGKVIRRQWVGWRAYEGAFHSATCAIRFAGASYRGGFRRKR